MKPVLKIIITGPESTGKTILAEGLASFFNTCWIPEYAREYVMSLQRQYTYEDVVHIAREQIRREKEYAGRADQILFYDTHLEVTKVWFMVVYNRYPDWLDDAIKNSGADLFLVCNTDIPWVPDGVRENGGEMRKHLLERYILEIEAIGAPWRLVSGKNEQRLEMAVQIISDYINKNKW